MVTPRILLVDDDPIVRQLAEDALVEEGFDVTVAGDAATALEAIATPNPHDLVVLDVMLPDGSGFDVCRTIRREHGMPIIMLTARADTVDVVTGLEVGADDYVTKPYEVPELVARVRAALRRVASDPATDMLVRRDLTIQRRAFRAFRGEDELALTTMEFRLLDALAADAGAALTREHLLERVWGYEYLGDSRLVDMAVKRLRDKLGDPHDGPPYISTVRGIGYRFERA